MVVTLAQSYFIQNCCNCGIAFAVPQEFDTERRKDAKSFFCPNGHSQSYGQSEADRLRAEIAAKQRLLETEQGHRATAERTADRLYKEKQRLVKRIAAGVCPCCNRTFVDLQRHMKTKHDGHALPPGAAQKQIAGTVQ